MNQTPKDEAISRKELKRKKNKAPGITQTFQNDQSDTETCILIPCHALTG